jgi:hypothetical protein
MNELKQSPQTSAIRVSHCRSHRTRMREMRRSQTSAPAPASTWPRRWLLGPSSRTAGICYAVAALVLASLAFGGSAQAQYLDAGKSAAQLFSANCSACHKRPQGLAKGRSAGALAGFLRQHYTTGREPASELGAYLASVGGEPAPAPRREPAAAAARTPATEPASAPASRQAVATPPRRPRQAGELATVSSDPDPVTISRQPVAVVHHRASSQAQEQRPPPPRPVVTSQAASQPVVAAASSDTGAPPAGDIQANATGALPLPAVSDTAREEAAAAQPQPFSGPLP